MINGNFVPPPNRPCMKVSPWNTACMSITQLKTPNILKILNPLIIL